MIEILEFPKMETIWISEKATRFQKTLTYTIYSIGLILPLANMLKGMVPGKIDRFDFETAVIRFLTGLGFVIFSVAVFVPFYVMIMTSLKNQRELLLNPLNFARYGSPKLFCQRPRNPLECCNSFEPLYSPPRTYLKLH